MGDGDAGVEPGQLGAPPSRSVGFALTEDPAGPRIGILGPAADGSYELTLGHTRQRVAADRLEAALLYLAGRVYLDRG